MVERPSDSRAKRGHGGGEQLPYRIELWDSDGSDIVERVIARAFNASLARAIFTAAMKEHPERRITLRRGSRVIVDSAK